MDKKYLYGASVQGIQSFIFETNKLKEIVGASQLIDNINDKEFKNFLGEHKYNDENVIINAAGNIKYIFDSEDDCKRVVYGFPKHISNYAPGITISQAVVEYDENKELDKVIDELENKLKVQRNKAQMPVDIGFIGLERARKTGKVGAEKKEKKGKLEVYDRGTIAKTKLTDEDTLSLFKKFTNDKVLVKNVPFDIEKITGKAENSWLAIIHADGNGLGNVLQNMADGIKNSDEFKKGNAQQKNDLQKEVFNTFSKKLKEATEKAAKIAFSVVEKNKEGIYPFRPVVLGGDDLTVIIRADLAYDFTKVFLSAFEKETESHFTKLNDYGVTKLTACAGIAYIKDSYPFHYGVHLAESLVKKSKKLSKSDEIKTQIKDKNLVPSSLSFYKVQSSFTEDLSDMIERTQFINDKNKNKTGVYFIDEITDYYNVKELKNLLTNLEEFANDKSKGISKLRQWISELYKDESKAQFMMDRIKSVNENFYKSLELDKYRNEPSLLNDLIQLHTFNQMYKNEKNEN